MSNLDHALAYLARKWSVIPIKSGTKLPNLNSWKEYQTRLPTEAEVREWWTKNPNDNIALVCGRISGVIVVDIDPKSGGTTEGLNLPPTLVSRTGGGGAHYIYKWNPNLIGAKVGVKAGIDIRSEASYIVAPPSLHASGNIYEWMNEGEEIAEPPQWLYREDISNTERKQTDWDAFFVEMKGEGIRNSSATQLAGKIMFELSPELWDSMGLIIFRKWNEEYATPPLSEAELMTTWNSIKHTHMKKHPAPLILAPATNDIEAEEQAVLKQFLKDKTKGTFWIAEYLTQKYNIITIGEHDREMYVYRNGYYKRAENEVVFPEIQRILGEHTTKNAKSETFSKIADMTSKNREVFYSAPLNFIPLANGVYNFETKELLPHDSTYRFTYQFPVQFKADAECPLTYTFMNQVLTSEQFTLLEEWLGYYFYRLYSFKKAVIFVGEGDTGKTTLLETIINLLGRTNISAVSLHKMTSDKFAASQLYDKHGNIVDELSAKDVTDTGNFKIATGGGSITGEYKFGNRFSFINYSKFTFACNRIPDVEDMNDEAYFNRWMVIQFEKPIEHKIPNFIQQLTTEEERSGMFNMAMRGLERLLKNGQFSYAKNAMETKTQMMRSSSTIALFTAEQLIQESGFEISKASMYDAYVSFCSDRELQPENMDTFGKKFLFYVSYATEGLIYDQDNAGSGKRVRGWRNVKVKPTPEELQKIEEFNKF